MSKTSNAQLTKQSANSEVASIEPVSQVVEQQQAVQRPRPSRGQYTITERPRRRKSRFKLWSFLTLVILPTIASIYYFGFAASNQYVSETRFGVRSAETRGNDASAIFQGMASASQIGLESNVVVQYAQSREIVDALQKSVDLRSAYSREGVDALAKLDPNVSIEELVDYWHGKIDPFFDLTTGSISVRVKAFTPKDAQRINLEVVRLSEALVNDMSRRAKSDTVQLATDEVSKAEKRLRKSREDILAFQNKQRVIDPTKQADSSLALVTKLRDQLAKLNVDLRTARANLSETAPTVKALINQINAQEAQIKQLDAQLTTAPSDTSGNSLSSTIEGFDALETERKLAEKYYDTTLETLQKAQVEANRQAIYLQVFVHPAEPQKALYPKRLQSIGLTLLACFGLWIFALLTVSSIRDHA
jgi:capsular polysaccharide transport system permease protein